MTTMKFPTLLVGGRWSGRVVNVSEEQFGYPYTARPYDDVYLWRKVNDGDSDHWVLVDSTIPRGNCRFFAITVIAERKHHHKPWPLEPKRTFLRVVEGKGKERRLVWGGPWHGQIVCVDRHKYDLYVAVPDVVATTLRSWDDMSPVLAITNVRYTLQSVGMPVEGWRPREGLPRIINLTRRYPLYVVDGMKLDQRELDALELFLPECVVDSEVDRREIYEN
jgi:hypothetical protein